MTTCHRCGAPHQHEPATYTVRGAAAALGVAESTIRTYCREGSLVVIGERGPGRETTIDGDSVRAMMRERA